MTETERLKAQIHRLKHRIDCLEGELYCVATNEDACTCEANSWYGRGHAFGCAMGDARTALGRSAMKRLGGLRPASRGF